MDFKKLEREIWISPEQKELLVKQLTRDLGFLDSINAVNYSMLLYKIDRTEESLNRELENEYRKTHHKPPTTNVK